MTDSDKKEPTFPPFIFNQPINREEDLITEFKEVTSANPVATIKDTVEEYAVGFLNSVGGTIIWGVRNGDRIATGVTLNSQHRDKLRRDVTSVLNNIQPALDPSQWDLEFHPLMGLPEPNEHWVVTLKINRQRTADPCYTHSGKLYIRLNGVNQSMTGPRLTSWIENRLHKKKPPSAIIDDPKVRDLIQRIRRVFTAHRLEPGQYSTFFKLANAPFSIEFGDLENDSTLLHWLDNQKLDWISKTFFIRRTWLNGADADIHEHIRFDKDPLLFYESLTEQIKAVKSLEYCAYGDAYFIRCGRDKEWTRNGQNVLVVLAAPIVRFDDGTVIYRYISDFTKYPWTYFRTHIQLRAWARLVNHRAGLFCEGKELPLEIANEVLTNSFFIAENLADHLANPKDGWNPEDYALSEDESRVAKDVENLPHVLAFLKSHNLPTDICINRSAE